MGRSKSRTAYSVLIPYVLTANLLSSTKSAYRPASGVPSGLLWPAWKWQPNLVQEASSARESLLLGFYWQHRLLKSLLLCGVYFYYNKIHSHCRASIIVNHIQTSVRFRCSSVVIKTYCQVFPGVRYRWKNAQGSAPTGFAIPLKRCLRCHKDLLS